MDDNIVIKGAREHNLKNVNLILPRNKFIVFTGLSGSGKTSLAFDTIYAEGQRRYMESLSSYARQFLGQMNKPDVDYIEGLSPSISIDQKTTSKNPRSTVGTVTEIYDYYRLLYARIGHIFCPNCKEELTSYTSDQIVDEILTYPEGTKILILAPIVKQKKGTFKKTIEKIKKEGFVRLIIDSQNYNVDDEINLDKNKKHDIDIVIDRIVVKKDIRSRLNDSIELALKLSNGLVSVQKLDGDRKNYSTNFACINCGFSMEELSPRLFSFNSPIGACSFCHGLGFSKKVDIDLIIPNKELSINKGAIAAYSNSKGTYYNEMFKALAKKYNFSLDEPIKNAPIDFMNALLYGSENEVQFNFDSFFSGTKTFKGTFEGIIKNLEKRYLENFSDKNFDKIEEFFMNKVCNQCNGSRLKKEALAVKINNMNISELTNLSIEQEIEFFKNIKLSSKENIIAKQIIKEINSRLNFLKNVGLNYLTLARNASTLSGGESQRIRLATQIGSQLVGVIYVLDEPSIGLHQRDNNKLIKTLKDLTNLGNTLIVVEHDEDTMRAADQIIDIGPFAGRNGGEIIAQGTVEEISKVKNSITGAYLSGRKKISYPKKRRKYNGNSIKIYGAQENNLKNINVDIPLGQFVAITGVSGSGKSSLVNEILYKSLAQKLNNVKIKPGKFEKIEGLENLDKVINIDQSPIGRTPRSNPATYTGIFDLIRDLFASTNEAKMKGYKKGRFSFNVKGGRCEACKGDGIIKVEMHFLPDVYVPCEVCKGERYNKETLQIRYRNKNISDILNMTIEEAMEFFENHPRIFKKLETLNEVGLSYIKLGQPSTQLSGGEAQRIKLASELSKRSTGKTIYILDEPTTGLHSEDVRKLLFVLQELVNRKNTVVVIEHNLDVIKNADYVIDLGPEGGNGGGEVIATGTPEEIAKNQKSYTGMFLKKIL